MQSHSTLSTSLKPIVAFVFAAILSINLPLAIHAQLAWDPSLGHTAAGSGGNGTWNSSTANWSNGTSDVVWDSNVAVFGGTSGTIQTSGNLTATGLTFNTSGYTLTDASGTNTLALSGSVDTTTNRVATIASTLTGSGFMKINTGTLILSGNNTALTGTVTVAGGLLQVNSSQALGGAAVTLSISTTAWSPAFVINGNGLTVANNVTLTGQSNAVTVQNSGGNNTYSGTMTFNRSSNLNVSNGTALTLTHGIVNNTNLAFSNLYINSGTTGTLYITGNGSGTGPTSIKSGKVIVGSGVTNGYGSGVTTLSGGVLGGWGTVGAVVMNTGGMAPGDIGSAGTLTATSLTWDGGSIMNFDLGLNQASSDLLTLTGALTKGAAGTFQFAFTDLGFTQGYTYNLITAGSISGFTASDFSSTGLTGTFAISGNTLQFTAVPEPGSIAMTGMGFAMLSLWMRTRRRRA